MKTQGCTMKQAILCLVALASVHGWGQEQSTPPQPGMVLYGEVWQGGAPLPLTDPPQALVLQAGTAAEVTVSLKKGYSGRTMSHAFVPAPGASAAAGGSPLRVAFKTLAGTALNPPQPAVDWTACAAVRSDILGNSTLPVAPAIAAAAATRKLDDWTLTCSLKWTPTADKAPAPALLVRWFAVLSVPVADTDRSFPEVRTGGVTIPELTTDGASFANVAAMAQGVLTPVPMEPAAADGTLAGDSSLTVGKAFSQDSIRYLEVQACTVDAAGNQSVMNRQIVVHSVAQADL